MSKRHTVFFLLVNPMNKDRRDPQELDLTKDTVYWVEKQLAQRKRLKFYQTRCNAIIFTIHSQLIVSRNLL